MLVMISDLSDGTSYFARSRADVHDSTDRSVFDEVARFGDTITMGKVIGTPEHFLADKDRASFKRYGLGKKFKIASNTRKASTMNRIVVAKELVRLAKELVSMEFPTQDAMDKYLKEHPDADRSLHRVVKNVTRQSPSHPWRHEGTKKGISHSAWKDAEGVAGGMFKRNAPYAKWYGFNVTKDGNKVDSGEFLDDDEKDNRNYHGYVDLRGKNTPRS